MAGRITLYRVAGYVTNLTLGLSPYWQCQNGVRDWISDEIITWCRRPGPGSAAVGIPCVDVSTATANLEVQMGAARSPPQSEPTNK